MNRLFKITTMPSNWKEIIRGSISTALPHILIRATINQVALTPKRHAIWEIAVNWKKQKLKESVIFLKVNNLQF